MYCMDMSRKKKMVSFALDPEILAELDAWLAKQEFPPSKTAVVEAALKAFLEARNAKD